MTLGNRHIVGFRMRVVRVARERPFVPLRVALQERRQKTSRALVERRRFQRARLERDIRQQHDWERGDVYGVSRTLWTLQDWLWFRVIRPVVWWVGEVTGDHENSEDFSHFLLRRSPRWLIRWLSGS